MKMRSAAPPRNKRREKQHHPKEGWRRQHHPRAAAFLVHGQKQTLTRSGITPDPTAGQAIHQLGDVERTVQSVKGSVEKLHEIHPEVTAANHERP